MFIWLDWVFIAIVLLSTFIAVFRGFVREAVSLSTWVIASLLAFHFARTVGVMAAAFTQSSSLQYAIGFLLVFFVIMIAGIGIGYLIKMLVSSTGLGFIDMILGGVFGFARGICIVALGVVLLSMPWLGMEKTVSESTIARDLQPVISFGSQYIPSEAMLESKLQGYMPDMSIYRRLN